MLRLSSNAVRKRKKRRLQSTLSDYSDGPYTLDTRDSMFMRSIRVLICTNVLCATDLASLAKSSTDCYQGVAANGQYDSVTLRPRSGLSDFMTLPHPLRRLSIRFPDIDVSTLLISPIGRVEVLDITGHASICNNFVSSLASIAPEICDLSVRHSTQLTATAFDALPKLRRVSVVGATIEFMHAMTRAVYPSEVRIDLDEVLGDYFSDQLASVPHNWLVISGLRMYRYDTSSWVRSVRTKNLGWTIGDDPAVLFARPRFVSKRTTWI